MTGNDQAEAGQDRDRRNPGPGNNVPDEAPDEVDDAQDEEDPADQPHALEMFDAEATLCNAAKAVVCCLHACFVVNWKPRADAVASRINDGCFIICV